MYCVWTRNHCDRVGSPENITQGSNVGQMLAHRLRRRFSIGPTLAQNVSCLLEAPLYISWSLQ